MTASNVENEVNTTIWPTKWGQERRLEFIDFRLLWEGRLNRADLTSHFGISVPQASMDLARYQELAPSNLLYDRQQKTYIPAVSFRPLMESVNAFTFLNQIRQVEEGMLPKEATFLGWYPSTGVVRLPARKIDVQVLRLLLDAIRRTIRIGIQYQSMSRTEPKERVISPHAIVFDGIRWHVRGYCHERNEFRDFVFARITDVSLDSSGLLGVNGDEDQAWNSFVEVKLAAAPHLSEGQRRAVEVDYGMDHGLLTLRVREALLLYFYQQLPLFEPVGRARYNQIILQNRESLLPHFEKLGIDL
jgi:hypothetical protein